MSNDAPRDPLIVGHYQQYLVDQDSAAFVKRCSQLYSTATLERLTVWGRRMTRRGSVLALGFLADYESNTVLGRALVDRDRGVRTLAENSIRNVWCRVGGDPQRQLLRAVQRLNQNRRFQDALARATELIHESPWLAEAWNQRGYAAYHTGDFEASIRDCHQALEINPYHFAAAAGMGQGYLQQKKQVAALEAFRRALRLNPNMEDVRAQVVKLQRQIKDD